MLKTTIFFGSGPVAALSLAKLLAWHPVASVVTKSTPPHHKEPAPVEAFARQHNIPLLYANTKQELDALELPECSYGIVIDYGVIISSTTIQKFPLGIINSHFSILPQWRGADPITFAILSGQHTTGVSLMRIDEGMDTGPLFTTQSLTIDAIDTGETLTHKLINLSDDLLRSTLPLYANGELAPTPQPDRIATYSAKLTKQSGIIDTSRPAAEIARQVRAFAGWPNSRLLYKDTWLTVTQAAATDYPAPNGTLVFYNNALYLGCKTGSLVISELQPAGKNKMSASAFMNGYAQKLSIKSI